MGSPAHAANCPPSRRHHCVRLDPAAGDVPPDWGQDAPLDPFQLASLVDVLLDLGGPAPDAAAVATSSQHPTAPPASRSSSLTEDPANSRSLSRPSSGRGESLSSSSSSCSSSSEPPASLSPPGPRTPTAKGKPSRGRPEGKFPFCPEGRCDHTEHWARVRTKKKYVFFICKHCGLGWCSTKLPGFVGGPKALCLSVDADTVEAPESQYLKRT